MSRPRLELDLIAAPRRARWPGCALLAVSLATALGVTDVYRRTSAAIERFDAAAALMAEPRTSSRPAKARLDGKSAETAVRQLTVPWGGLIQAVEGAASEHVALLHLQPEAGQRVLRIAAEARHREAMFEYLGALASAKGLTQVHLVKHQVQLDDPQRPIRFSVQASFKAMK